MVGVLFALGCGADSQAEATVSPDQADGYAYATAQSRGEAKAKTVRTSEPRDGRASGSESSTSVYVDPSLAAACGWKKPELYFELDSSKVRDQGENKLDELTQCLNGPLLQLEQVQVVGHTDPQGSERYNEDLARDRARSVAVALEAHGLSSNRIWTLSKGESEASKDPADWPTDRRVEIRLRP
jgi:outer membrane protein OmpA-like peptidoglycan-associated protein